MKKIIILFALFSTALNAQNLDDLPSNLKNRLTRHQTKIPATRYSIAPPEGFTLSVGSHQLRIGDTCVIEFVEQFEMGFDSIVSLFERFFPRMNGKVINSKNIQFGNYKAKIFEMESQVEERIENPLAFYFMFGDSIFSGTVQAIFPKRNVHLYKSILHSLSTLHYDPRRKIDFNDICPYTVDTSKSDYKFSEYIARLFDPGAFQYTFKGIRLPDQDAKISSLNITTPTMDTVFPAKVFCEFIAENQGSDFRAIESKHLSSDPINGYEAEEMSIDGLERVSRQIRYIACIRHEKLYLVINGVIFNDFENNLREMRNLVHSIKFKKN